MSRRSTSRSRLQGSWKYSKRCGLTHGASAWSTSCATCSWHCWSSQPLPWHDILRIFSDKDFRTQIARSLKNQAVRRFFDNEFEKFSSRYRVDATAPIQNKVGAFLADPLLDRMLTAPKRELRVRQVMDKGQVLIANLAKGRIGEDSSSLLGGLLVTTIGLAAYTRADTPSSERRDFFVYIDEFQSFTTLALANMPSELRKYRVGFTIAHQYLQQLSPEIGTRCLAMSARSFHLELAWRMRRTLRRSSRTSSIAWI
jgi:hypothetical protein